jgi:ketosteroid isomerase-like protein
MFNARTLHITSGPAVAPARTPDHGQSSARATSRARTAVEADMATTGRSFTILGLRISFRLLGCSGDQALVAHWFAIFLSLAVAACAATATAAANRSEAAEVETADQRFNHALERSDVETLRKMIAETYVFTDPSGRVSTRQDVIGGFERGRIRIESQTTRDVHIEVYGDAAVETGVLNSVARRDGRDTGGTFRFTRVWLKRVGRWQTVAFQETAPQH